MTLIFMCASSAQEGTLSRLPWAIRIPAFIKDPCPVLPILERLKDDSDLYVRRSVANYVGDIAKYHPCLAFELCEQSLRGCVKGAQVAALPCSASSGQEGREGGAAITKSGEMTLAISCCRNTLSAGHA